MSATTAAAAATAPITARSILTDAGLTDLGERLSASQVLDDTAGRLQAAGSSLWEGANSELARLADDFLTVDIATVLVNGWRKHRELLDAGARTQGTVEPAVVPLVTRDLSLVQRPSVDVVLGDVTVTAVRFELRIDVTAVALSGIVSFSASGVSLAKGERTVDPHLMVALGDGIRLVPVPAQRSPGHDGLIISEPTTSDLPPHTD